MGQNLLIISFRIFSFTNYFLVTQAMERVLWDFVKFHRDFVKFDWGFVTFPWFFIELLRLWRFKLPEVIVPFGVYH